MHVIRIPVPAVKGRGTPAITGHRFLHETRDVFDDGWGTLDAQTVVAHAPPLTQVTLEDAKSAITQNDSPDIYFDHGLNPYRGCEHGCVYCYARPTHSYLSLSPGLDFETRIIAKRNLATVLAAELAARNYQPKQLVLGSATDAYQPVERSLGITRRVIEMLARCSHATAIVTKGSGVLRDLDVLAPMAAARLVAVYVTITTLDARLARILEPRAASPIRRLQVIEALAAAGVPVGVSVAPQIPFINEDMEQVLVAASEAGAQRAFYTVLRLPWELDDLFQQWLATHFPQRAARVMARVQDMRGGKNYDSDFASRMKGKGVWAELIRQRFEKTCLRLGLNRSRFELNEQAFTAAALTGQARLFE